MIQFLFQRPFHGQLSSAQFPYMETVAMNFSTFRFVVALPSAAVPWVARKYDDFGDARDLHITSLQLRLIPAEAARRECRSRGTSSPTKSRLGD
jgi:hypothetical protein